VKLIDFIVNETGELPESIMFLRHGNDKIDDIRKYGVSIEEYTFLQEIEDKYDFFNPENPKIAIVVVVVKDFVYEVFRVVRVNHEGLLIELASNAYKTYIHAKMDDSELKKQYRKFKIEPILSECKSLPVSGWTGSRTRTPALRSSGTLMDKIEIDVDGDQVFYSTLDTSFKTQVEKSLKSDQSARMRRLETANEMPACIQVISRVYVRNSDVVAEVLFRANGICGRCKNKAPFHTADGRPYLEVHHKIRLADKGPDTVQNAIALCPNCHRELHYGVNRDL
jgi:hypothetical protein